MWSYTVNVAGDQRAAAQALGYRAYYADGVTAIEGIKADNKRQARAKVTAMGFRVLYVFI